MSNIKLWFLFDYICCREVTNLLLGVVIGLIKMELRIAIRRGGVKVNH